MITKPTVSKYKETVNKNTLAKQIATSPGVEITSIVVTGGSGATALRVYDSEDGTNHPEGSFLVAANGGESTPFNPSQPISMKRGLYIVLEQGGAGNGEATIFYN